jgi:hypothetical protein
MRFTAFRAALAAVGVCMLAACAQTMVNSGPSAVPAAISWIVQVVDSGDTKNVSGSGNVTVPRGGSVRVYVHAKSVSGVKTVSLGQFVDADWTCISGNIGQNMDATIAGATQSQPPNAQNDVDLDLVLFQVYDVGFSCNSGFHYSGGAISLNAKATNFAGKSVSASLTIHVSN